MSGHMLDLVFHAVTENDSYFMQKPDSTVQMGISLEVKVTAAFHSFAFGYEVDTVGELLRVVESAMPESVYQFVDGVSLCFEKHYLCEPCDEDLK